MSDFVEKHTNIISSGLANHLEAGFYDVNVVARDTAHTISGGEIFDHFDVDNKFSIA
jgi:hypothetical protein